MDSLDVEISADRVVRLYLQEDKKCGLENVARFTPYRKNRGRGKRLNTRLLDLVSLPGLRPHTTGVFSVWAIRSCRPKNLGEVNNGDIGYVTNIFHDTAGTTTWVNFGDSREVEYNSSQLPLLDWEYASTVYKSQESEYQSLSICVEHITSY